MNPFNKSSQKEKKELTPTQQKVKIALNWTVNVLCIILIIFALVVAILTIIRSTNPDKITRIGDNCYFNVVSDSMKPTFKKNDIIVAKAYDGDGSDLKVGQVITFKFVRTYEDGNGYDEFNSHRIVAIEKNKDGSVSAIRTRGDNQEGNWQDVAVKDGEDISTVDQSSWDVRRVVVSDVVATWGDVDENLNFTSGKIMKGAGSLAAFMQHPIHGKTRFFCLIVLPLILLFVIYAFILVRTLIIAKLEKEKKVAGETAISVDTMTEEEKQALIAQLLASQKSDTAVNEDASQAEESTVADNDGDNANVAEAAEETDTVSNGDNVIEGDEKGETPDVAE